MRSMVYITRQDAGTVHAWIVKIGQGTSSEISKSFSDNQYGGREASLAAAQIWRDRRVEERGNKRTHVRHKSLNNSSGYVGISQENGGSGWRAIYNIDKRQRQRSFAVRRYGDCRAFQMACKARYDATGELRQILEVPNVPCEPGLPVVYSFETQTKHGDDQDGSES